MVDAIVNTSYGPIRGLRLDGVDRYLGVPYAAGPTGALRFAPPSPAIKWSDCHDATHHGPTAPQPERPIPGLNLAPIDGPGWRQGDNFLTVNVWTKSLAKKRPVMVFIHGGSFIGGCSESSAYDGAGFARLGIVLFSINYRLGIEGFLPLPGGATNLGLRDQIAAIAWIKENAAAFGGDPENITVFGQSAGGMAIACLMSSPKATGLFRRAIIQSGGGSMVRSLASAQPLVAHIAETMGIEPTKQGFCSRSIAQCTAATGVVMKSGVVLPDAGGRDPGFGLSPFLPVFGDDVLPIPPLAALRAGVSANVDLLIGTTVEETNLFFVPGLLDAHSVGELLMAADPGARDIVAAYTSQMNGATFAAVLTQAMTDLVFRAPARTFADAHQGNTHFYEFGWRSPACGGALGACHCLELPFVFGTLEAASGADGLLGFAPPEILSTQIQRIWADFASGGSVPWPPYEDTTRQVFRLETAAILSETITVAEASQK